MTRKKGLKQSRLAKPGSIINSLELYRQWLNSDEYESLEKEIKQPLNPSIRLNPLKVKPEFTAILTKKYGWLLKKIPFSDSGYQVDIGKAQNVSDTLEHRLGLYYIQEAASMLPVELFNLSNLEYGLSLDMAASPGGKTTHLVSRLNDKGLVIANDSSQGRIQALRIILQNWGAVNTAVTCIPGESFGILCPGVFDRVLLDAPCSMQGLRTAESHPIKKVSERESLQLSKRQVALLRSALHAVRLGGEVVYSTCTLLPQEDEIVVDTILKELKGQVTLLDAQKKLPFPAPGLQFIGNEPLSNGMEQTIRFWPHRYHTAGFFACLLRKEADILPTTEPNATYTGSVPSRNYLSDHEIKEFCESFQDQFGYDLRHYCESEGMLLARQYERIRLTPAILEQRFPQLNTLSTGILIGEQTPDGFLPSFEWISRFGPDCTNNIVYLDMEQVSQWISGKNILLSNRNCIGNNRYRILLHPQGWALGCAKVVGSELKNLLPRRFIYSSSSL